MKQYLLFPFTSADLHNTIFESPYGVLRDKLHSRDINLQTYDLGDLKTADAVLYFNHQPSMLARAMSAQIPVEKRILFLFEPEVVLPEQYKRTVWHLYGKIFTSRDDLVDNKKIFKMRFPQGQLFLSQIPGHQERKFLTLINANKYSFIKNELYSFRRQAIRYFEQHHKDFDLFGYGWDSNVAVRPATLLSALRRGAFSHYAQDVYDSLHPYKSYRGAVHDKPATLMQYKFSLAFENEKEVLGYITEKIFDCLFSGTVPIYFGAKNILDFIPESCFIDMRNFHNFEALDRHLSSISEQDFLAMQRAGQDFIHGPLFKDWSPDGVFEMIANQLSL